MNEFGFDFAISLKGGPLYDKHYGSLSVYVQKNEWEHGNWSTWRTYKEELELVRCDDTNFNYSNYEEMEVKGIYSSYCINNKSKYAMGGTFNSNTFQHIKIEVVPC